MTRFQPGFIIPAPAAGGLTLASRADATSTGATITIPATAQVGDLAVLIDWAGDAGVLTGVTPTGWTEIGQDNIINRDGRASYKVLIAGDPGSTITGSNGDIINNKTMHVFSGGITAVDKIFHTSEVQRLQVTNDDPTSRNLAASAETAPLIVFSAVAKSSVGAAVWTTESPALGAKVTNDRLVSGYKIYNSSPADHTFDKGDEGTNGLWSFGLAVS